MTQPFTPEQIKEDGKNRVVKTTGQNAVAAAFVLIAVEGLKGRGWLHGGIGIELFAAYSLVLTVVASAANNWSKLRGKA